MSQLDLFPLEQKKAFHTLPSEMTHPMDIENALMDVFYSNPGRLLDQFELVTAINCKSRDRTSISGILDRMEHSKRITSHKVYFGAETPGDPNYQGFSYRYKLASNT